MRKMLFSSKRLNFMIKANFVKFEILWQSCTFWPRKYILNGNHGDDVDRYELRLETPALRGLFMSFPTDFAHTWMFQIMDNVVCMDFFIFLDRTEKNNLLKKTVYTVVCLRLYLPNTKSHYNKMIFVGFTEIKCYTTVTCTAKMSQKGKKNKRSQDLMHPVSASSSRMAQNWKLGSCQYSPRWLKLSNA